MSRENVELVRRLFEAYAEDGVEPATAFFAPDIVWNPADEVPQHGPDGVIAYMERWEGEWEELQTIPEEFVDAGDRVLITVHFSGRGRTSAIEVDARLYEVYTLHEGKITRMDEFTDRAAALEAAGLSE
jgi:ketosteroid isomerase-like protein